MFGIALTEMAANYTRSHLEPIWDPNMLLGHRFRTQLGSFSLHKELSQKVGDTQNNEEAVEEQGWPGESLLPLQSDHVDQCREDEHQHQAARCT